MVLVNLPLRNHFEKIDDNRKQVRFQLTPSELYLLNMSIEREVETGLFDLMIWVSCQDIRLKGTGRAYFQAAAAGCATLKLYMQLLIVYGENPVTTACYAIET